MNKKEIKSFGYKIYESILFSINKYVECDDIDECKCILEQLIAIEEGWSD